MVQGDRRGRNGRGRGGGGIAEERLFNGRISEIVRTYICWQIYESAFLLKWGKLLLLLLLLLLPPPPPPPPPPTPPPPLPPLPLPLLLLLRPVVAAATAAVAGAGAATAAAATVAVAVAVIATTTRCGIVLVVMVTAVLVEEKAATAGVADRKRRGEVHSLPQPGIFEPRLALYSRSHLTFTDRGESRAFYPPPTLASACPPSMQTFLLILSFAISPSISHWCNFPVGDLYDVKICVVYLATTPCRFSPRSR